MLIFIVLHLTFEVNRTNNLVYAVGLEDISQPDQK